ncbi:SpoIIE family protein phosphatase [Streptomyces sioyaensis]|uniref:SpoIIE family protein phosphatase n=1 Tax=Streptomyces sioyaensis TaxID=67364 RepID=UPI0033E537DA
MAEPQSGTPLATVLVDPDGRIQVWSKGAQVLTGYPEQEVIGRDAALLADRTRLRGGALVEALLRTADSVRTDWLRCRDGTCRSVTWHPVPVPLETGTGVLAVAVPEAQMTDRGHAVTLDRLLHYSPVGLAVIDTDLRFRYVNEAYARMHRIPAEQHLGRSALEILDVPDAEALEKTLRRVVGKGETIENLRVAAYRPDGDPYVVVGNLFPLQGPDGRVMGVGGVVYESAEGRAEILDTAHGRRRLELLGRVSAGLGQGLDPRTVATGLVAACVPGFAGAVEVDLLESATQPTADSFDVAESDEQPAAPPRPLFHPLNLTSGTSRPRPEDELPQPRPTLRAASQCVSSAQPVAFETVAKDGSALHGMAVPLIAIGRVIGAVTFLRQVDAFSSEDTLLAREIAARTATALDNALLYRRERLAALALQRHLLPAQLPSAEWYQLAYRYRPAEDDTLAGGDWYDAVPLPGGRIGLVIGDVIGHGVGAAAAMGCYRSSVHALLAVGLPPGQLLTRFDGLLTGDGELAATCTCVVYDGGVGRCSIALAGHPPPLLVMPDGSVALLECEPGPPVGMGFHDVYADREHTVPPGSLIVLYTDGMIEDRKAVLDLDQGIALLSRAVRDPKAPLDEICDAMTAVRPASSADDAALLVARLGRF